MLAERLKQVIPHLILMTSRLASFKGETSSTHPLPSTGARDSCKQKAGGTILQARLPQQHSDRMDHTYLWRTMEKMDFHPPIHPARKGVSLTWSSKVHLQGLFTKSFKT
ncbi:hypothetical protein R1flu_017159 [Riccia fluitans]|uniref:Uncharacterized protein n=1 Tax=Riccia fluitans TaxID=41844 RepID=A0ABD1XE37_9MARC